MKFRRRQVDRLSSSSSSSGRLSARFRAAADGATYLQLMGMAVAVRLAVLLAMALSCHWIPDLVSGDGSLAGFHLRLVDTTTSISSKMIDGEEEPFVLPGSFCDCGFSCGANISNNIYKQSTKIATANASKKFWSFLLTPLTRWDAARFLRLAHRPTIRYPRLERRRQLHERSQNVNDTDVPTTTCSSVITDAEMILQDAEEAHPFLPLFPFLIQVTCSFLQWILPAILLPPTCESVLTLAAFILNTLCFVWAASELYQMTKSILKYSIINLHSLTKDDNTRDKPKPYLTPAEVQTVDCQARRVTLLFLCNPANVFFGTAYSESLGAALVFTGCRWIIQHRCTSATKTKSTTARLLYYVGAVAVWWMGCLVRSNGSLYGGYVVFHGMGMALQQPQSIIRRILCVSIGLCSGIFLFVGGIGLHNYTAFRNYCLPDTAPENESIGTACRYEGYQRPDWCEHGAAFNLYSHVQHKYWNVGLFHYYELKQIPNFLLAAPVLVFSIFAVLQWIYHSWNSTIYRAKPTKIKRRSMSSSLLPTVVTDLIDWAIISLRLFVADSGKPESVTPSMTSPSETLAHSPILLGHYAVLAASTVLCLAVAHVQIATRLIFSTCPAIYWFLATQISRGGILGDAVVFWCLLYNIVGIIMHPNWLPWT